MKLKKEPIDEYEEKPGDVEEKGSNDDRKNMTEDDAATAAARSLVLEHAKDYKPA